MHISTYKVKHFYLHIMLLDKKQSDSLEQRHAYLRTCSDACNDSYSCCVLMAGRRDDPASPSEPYHVALSRNHRDRDFALQRKRV